MPISQAMSGFVTGGRCRDEDSTTSGELQAIYVLTEQWDTGTGSALHNARSDALRVDAFTDAERVPPRPSGSSIRYRLQIKPSGTGPELVNLRAVELRDRQQQIRRRLLFGHDVAIPFSLPCAPPISRAGGLLRSCKFPLLMPLPK